MGVPGFAQRVRIYGAHQLIGQATGQHSTAVAIIDGPSLAHAIYHEHRRSCGQISVDVIAVRHDYSALANAFILWLQRLGSYGYQVESIFFDGSLPSFKEPERRQRLSQDANSLSKFKRVRDEASASDISAHCHSLQTARARLSPPAFFVSAIIEALLDSPFAGQTLVVPGEADHYCAAAALRASHTDHEQSISIFTNDSDLIVYESGLQTKVVLINSIEEVNSPDGSPALGWLEFWPSTIAMNRLELAYSLHMNTVIPSGTDFLPRPADQVSFAAFAATYDTAEASKTLAALEDSRARGDKIILTDPRVSELVTAASLLRVRHDVRHSTSQRATARHILQSADESELHLYLPVLFEDPSRSSAWKMGQTFRSLAVSLLLVHAQLDCRVTETKRVGSDIKASEVDVLSAHEVRDSLSLWTDYLASEVERLQHLHHATHRWLLLILQLLVSDLRSQNVSPPPESDAITLLQRGDITTWSMAHLSARMQSEFWSLRMVVHVADHMRAHKAGVDSELKACIDRFVDLITSGEFPSVVQFSEANIEEDQSWVEMLKENVEPLIATP